MFTVYVAFTFYMPWLSGKKVNRNRSKHPRGTLRRGAYRSASYVDRIMFLRKALTCLLFTVYEKCSRAGKMVVNSDLEVVTEIWDGQRKWLGIAGLRDVA